MKRKLALAAILSALFLTACSGENSSGSSQSGDNLQASTESNVPDSAPSESVLPITEEAATDTKESGSAEENVVPTIPPEELDGIEDLNNLYGPDGEKVDKYTITSIHYGYDDEGNEDKTKWLNVDCDGFAYYSEPRGFSYNSVDNAELLDKENWRFNVDELPTPEYKRCEVGDTVCGLKVTYASAMFGTANADMNFVFPDDSIILGRELNIPEVFFLGGSISFEGSLDMTGYIFICPEDEGYNARGDILFTPDKESCVLPVVNFEFNSEKGIFSRSYTVTHDGEFFYMSEYPSIYAGNIFSSELDFADYPIGEPIKVKLTADNINMSSNVDWITQTQFVITDIEKIG